MEDSQAWPIGIYWRVQRSAEDESGAKVVCHRQGKGRGKPKFCGEDPSHFVTLSTANLTRTDLESNLSLRGNRPATDSLSH